MANHILIQGAAQVAQAKHAGKLATAQGATKVAAHLAEGIGAVVQERIKEFIGSLLNAIGKRKRKYISKKLDSDKKLQSYIKHAEKAADDIEKHIKDRRKNDPEYDAAAQAFDDFLKS